jgi:hypothetical protein
VSSVCNGDDTGVELEGVTEVTRKASGVTSLGLAAALDAQVFTACCTLQCALARDDLQAHALSSHSSPGRKRPKSGAGGGPSASQPGIEMFMKQAPPPPAAASSGRSAAGFEKGQALDMAAVDDISDDDDAPMVAAAGLNAARSAQPASAARSSVRAAPLAAPSSSASSSSASAAAAAHAPSLVGSKRSAAAADAAFAAHIDPSHSGHKVTVGAAVGGSGGTGVTVVGGDIADSGDVLEIDDLDSMFAL